MPEPRLFQPDEPDSWLTVVLQWDEGKQGWWISTRHCIPGHDDVVVLQRFDGEDWQELLSSMRFETTVFWDEVRTGSPFVER